MHNILTIFSKHILYGNDASILLLQCFVIDHHIVPAMVKRVVIHQHGGNGVYRVYPKPAATFSNTNLTFRYRIKIKKTVWNIEALRIDKHAIELRRQAGRQAPVSNQQDLIAPLVQSFHGAAISRHVTARSEKCIEIFCRRTQPKIKT